MKRAIKFRAWDKPSKKMIFADEVVIKENGYDCVFKEEGYRFSVTDELNGELMQFTGLHDKNGKEIWEGDIVEWFSQESHDDIERYYYKVEEPIEFKGGAFYPVCTMPESEYEVIGNIFENPELLKP